MVALLLELLAAIWACISLSASSPDINGLRANAMAVILNVTLVDVLGVPRNISFVEDVMSSGYGFCKVIAAGRSNVDGTVMSR